MDAVRLCVYLASVVAKVVRFACAGWRKECFWSRSLPTQPSGLRNWTRLGRDTSSERAGSVTSRLLRAVRSSSDVPARHQCLHCVDQQQGAECQVTLTEGAC